MRGTDAERDRLKSEYNKLVEACGEYDKNAWCDDGACTSCLLGQGIRHYRELMKKYAGCPTCGEPLEVHGSGERFPCPDGGGYFVEMEEGK
jgi:hypothetical protein